LTLQPGIVASVKEIGHVDSSSGDGPSTHREASSAS